MFLKFYQEVKLIGITYERYYQQFYVYSKN